MKDIRNFGPMILMMFLFFLWGFITIMNAILVPQLKLHFSLNYLQVMFVQVAFYLAFFLFSFPSGRLTHRIGYKKSLVVGVSIATVGALSVYLSSYGHHFVFFLIGLFILAVGVVLMQVTANPYVSLLGEERSASSRLNLAFGFYSVGTILAPILGSFTVLSFKGTVGIELIYLTLTFVLAALAILFMLSKFPKISETRYLQFQEHLSNLSKEKEGLEIDDRKNIWHFPHLILGAVAIFFYVGAEISIASFLPNFFMSHGVQENLAGAYLSYYWGLAMIGRFIGFLIFMHHRVRPYLIFNALAILVLMIVSLCIPNHRASFLLLGVGFFNSIMFPAIFSLAIAGLKKKTPIGSGVLLSAMVGGAIIPILQGIVSDSIGIRFGFVIPFLCYVYVLYYGIKGSIAFGKKLKS